MHQPVFHAYDVRYMIWPPGILSHALPSENKFTNLKAIQTHVLGDEESLSSVKFNSFVRFVQQEYWRNKDNVFAPTADNIRPYFHGHFTKPFLSLYCQPEYLTIAKTGVTMDRDKVVGIITSRPMHISIRQGPPFPAYYVDYLCVAKTHRKQGIAQQLIQTHHYNQRRLNGEVAVSLFKREEELTGIVPLCVYPTYGFKADRWTQPPPIDAAYSIVAIQKTNLQLLFDFLKEQQEVGMFDLVATTSMTNLMELLQTNNVFIRAVVCHAQIIAAYFFRKSCVEIERGVEVLTCIASICDTETDHDLFVAAFKLSFWEIAATHHFGCCAVEEIAHNRILADNLRQKTPPFITSPTAYFFYNFAYPTFAANKVFILN